MTTLINNCKLLIVDDEVDFTNILKLRLHRKGYDVTTFNDSVQAAENVTRNHYDVILLDIMMNDIDGLQLLDITKQHQPHTEVIMLTGYANVETAIQAMKKGAYDYLSKPVKPLALEVILEKAIEKKRLKDNHSKLVESTIRKEQQTGIIGESKVMLEMKDLISKFAASVAPVLITGESGTGKELVAKALHYCSKRADSPFVPINASAIPEHLLESELFGHIKGAFTGANTNKRGLIELAEGGTLFLDEIADMDIGLQAKILRFLDSGEYRAVGSTSSKTSNVRIVAATNKNLVDAISKEEFRDDLYYRLGVLKIHIPPLRERGDDLLLLANHFLKIKDGQKTKKHFTESAVDALKNYDFPGNVRELVSIIERCLLLTSKEQLTANDLLLPNDNYKCNCSLSLQEVEKNHILCVLKEVEWDKPRAAEILKIGLRTLYRKIDDYHLQQ